MAYNFGFFLPDVSPAHVILRLSGVYECSGSDTSRSRYRDQLAGEQPLQLSRRVDGTVAMFKQFNIIILHTDIFATLRLLL